MRRTTVDACGRFDAIIPPKQDSHGKKKHFSRGAEDSRRTGEESSLALELDDPSRQPHPRGKRCAESRWAPGLLRLARRHHDGALFPCAAAAGPRRRKAACLTELP